MKMSRTANFEGYTIVSCGTLRPELEYLKKEVFLNADRILYTAPGLHENPHELEKQLKRQLSNAKRYSRKVIVVYGSRCYIDIKNPSRDIDKLIQEESDSIRRIQARNCIDMLASESQRDKISRGQKVYWLSSGWLEYWKIIFKDWDQGKANETFPRHDKAILLDSLGMFDRYSTDSPERILKFSDWMGLGIEPCKVSLDRLKDLFIRVVESGLT